MRDSIRGLANVVYGAIEPSILKLRGYLQAGPGHGNAADQPAGLGGGQDGITPPDGGQRAHGLQRAGEFLQVAAPGAQRIQRMALQSPLGRGQPLAQGVEPARRLLRVQAPGDPRSPGIADVHQDLGDDTLSAAVDVDLADGSYVVAWAAVSEDSHPISGAFGFAVGAPSDDAAALLTETGDRSAPESGRRLQARIIDAAKALLEKNPDPTEEEARYWLAGNLCRCTGYDTIVTAVQKCLDDAD